MSLYHYTYKFFICRSDNPRWMACADERCNHLQGAHDEDVFSVGHVKFVSNILHNKNVLMYE